MEAVGDELVIACNGMIGREVFTADDREGTFYMIGSMGLASSIGLGVALCRADRRVLVIDGDGNVLMGPARSPAWRPRRRRTCSTSCSTTSPTAPRAGSAPSAAGYPVRGGWPAARAYRSAERVDAADLAARPAGVPTNRGSGDAAREGRAGQREGDRARLAHAARDRPAVRPAGAGL